MQYYGLIVKFITFNICSMKTPRSGVHGEISLWTTEVRLRTSNARSHRRPATAADRAWRGRRDNAWAVQGRLCDNQTRRNPHAKCGDCIQKRCHFTKEAVYPRVLCRTTVTDSRHMSIACWFLQVN